MLSKCRVGSRSVHRRAINVGGLKIKGILVQIIIDGSAYAVHKHYLRKEKNYIFQYTSHKPTINYVLNLKMPIT